MTEPFKEGFWYLPEDEKNQVYGTLTGTRDLGFDLRLIGQTLKGTHFKWIYGISTEGKQVRLKGCTKVQQQQNMGTGIAKQKFKVGQIFVGDPNDMNSETSKCLNVRFSNVHVWADVSGFKHERSEKDIEKIIYSPPPLIKWQTPDILITLFSSHTTSLSNFPRRMNIEEKIFLAIESSKEIDFDEFFHRLGSLQQLLGLLIGRPIKYLELNSPTDGGNTTEVFFGQRTGNQEELSIPFNALIPFSSIRDSLAEIVTTWFLVKKRYSAAINFFYQAYVQSEKTIEVDFLNLFFAYRGFLTAKKGEGNPISPNEMQANQSSSEYPKIFRNGIFEVLEILGERNQDNYVERTFFWWDRITTAEQETKWEQKEFDEIIKLSALLHLASLIFLLKELNFPKEFIGKRIQSYEKFLYEFRQPTAEEHFF